MFLSGAIAQLVERFVRIEEVRGSNPLSSTFAGPVGALPGVWKVSAFAVDAVGVSALFAGDL